MVKLAFQIIVLIACLTGGTVNGETPPAPEAMAGSEFGAQVPQTGNPQTGNLEQLPNDQQKAAIKSDQNRQSVAKELAPGAQSNGTTYGTALNPNNSALSPSTVNSVNEATESGLEEAAIVNALEEENKLLPNDAMALKSLLALELLDSSAQAAGNTTYRAATPSPSAPAQQTAEPIVTPGFDPNGGTTYIPTVKTTARTGLNYAPTMESLSPISQPDTVLYGSDGTSQTIPYSQPATVVLAAGDATSATGSARSTYDDAAPAKKPDLQSNSEITRGLASTYRGSTVIPQSSDAEDLSQAIAMKLANRLAAGKKAIKDENTPTSSKGVKPLLTTMLFVDGRPKGVTKKVEEPVADDSDAIGASLWPDLVDRRWNGVKNYVSGALGFSDYAAAPYQASAPFDLLLLAALFLAGVTLPFALMANLKLRNAALRRFPKLHRWIPTRTEVVAYASQANGDFQTQLVPSRKMDGSIGWQVALRNKSTQELIVVGVPKEDAVFTAQCLPTRFQNELNIEHGLERVQFNRGREFEKTSKELIPAFRPFPDKIAFLQKNGFLKGVKKRAA